MMIGSSKFSGGHYNEGDLLEKGWSIVYLSDKPYQAAWYAKYRSALIGPFIFRATAVERARSFSFLPSYYQERLWAMHWERRALNAEETGRLV